MPKANRKGTIELGKNGRPKLNLKIIGRVVKMLFKFYPVLMPLTVLCIIFSAAVSAIPANFQQKIIELIEIWYQTGDWESAKSEIFPLIFILIGLYIASIIAMLTYTQLMAYIGQGFLHKMRVELFDKMQDLPISFFDRKPKGDLMSYYTNDIDTLRELVTQALVNVVRSGVIVAVLLYTMLRLSVWLTLLVLLGVVAMFAVSAKIGGGSARFFMKQQTSVGKLEGFIQEMMSGQKVVKVFNHEDEARKDFTEFNNRLYEDGFRAHAYANSLGPIIMNIGNVLYVLTAFVGGVLLVTKAPNLSIAGLAMGIDVVVPFLNMTKQFTGNVNTVSQQINVIAMATAGAERVFAVIDAEPEIDEGYVTLVNAEIDENGNITESESRTGHWAWKHPHSADGTVTYTPLAGDVRLEDVHFSYNPEKIALRGITLYAEPGQKVAFVGATGAGKTTIANLLNRFYDVTDGKVRYDGININKIRKADLRRAVGIVLQDTSLFTGSVLENIRYGRLDASDDDCKAAAKLVGADDFITRLPDGYNTELTGNGANLSQGQRQLIAIARAAVADPPVMILDEATSSIDTRTEAIVSRGMDKLMEGRTVFVIAHRLSTVMNSDVIMVLDHGKIIERGSHDKLIEEKGTYYQLYTGAFELE